MKFNCELCGQDCNRAPSIYNKQKHHYCGRACAAIMKRGAGNVNWKGSAVGLSSLHEWVKYRLSKPNACQNCGEAKPLDLANISQEYKRDLTDWEWLCRKCHMAKDGRAARLRFTRPHTAETKQKIGQHFKGRKLSPEAVAKRMAGRTLNTHCRHGHEYTSENTKWDDRDGSRRYCVACKRRNNRAAWRRQQLKQTGIAAN